MRQEKKEPDCATCIHKDECALARDGHFCPAWASVTPQPRGEDPNARWRRGEDVDF